MRGSKPSAGLLELVSPPYGARLNRRIVEGTGRPPDAAAADSARANRQDRRASGRRAALPVGQGKRSEAEPRDGLSHHQDAEDGRAGGRAGPDALRGRPALLRNAALATKRKPNLS